MQSEDFIQNTARLRELGGQRVWSLMISLFGDLAQGKGDVINGPVLTSIMGMLEVKPEATRVALHRLRNDDWITSQKIGRISQHALTAKGRAECAAASPRIYAPHTTLSEGWQLVLLEDTNPETCETMIENGFTPLTPRAFVGPTNLATPKDALRLSGEHVPSWLAEQLEPPGLRNEYLALLSGLTKLRETLPTPGQISPLETAVLRCLIVHNWRRLVLRHPTLPKPLMKPDWPGLTCHALVTDMLDTYPRPQLRDIRSQTLSA